MATSPALDLCLRAEEVDHFKPFGVTAFVTGRAAGSFGTQSEEPVSLVMGRWSALRAHLGGPAMRLATATQVHGARVVRHESGWRGWLREDGADGHCAIQRGTAMAVTVADCVPVLIAHPSGACAAIHSGWRGTAAGITEVAVRGLVAAGLRAADLHLHCGPAICGRCYEVSAEVAMQLIGVRGAAASTVDLRAIIADRSRALGVRHITISTSCTRCDNDRYFSHRAGDAGRQLGVIASPA